MNFDSIDVIGRCVDANDISGAASAYLNNLVENGLLQEVKAGRENLSIDPALLALLTERGRA